MTSDTTNGPTHARRGVDAAVHRHSGTTAVRPNGSPVEDGTLTT